ncbi:MAG TPA: hypothetical protein PKA10_03480 [Selenomonadales bacterium]|nr:hypothetical protein [Selenomonadales bacterium]
MTKKIFKTTVIIGILALALVAAGCGGGGGGVQRISGLPADGVVKAFYDSAKADRLKEAALYVSPASTSNPGTVIKYLTGQNGLKELKASNLLSLREVAQQGNYAAVVATLQTEQNSMKVTVKPVGLEKIDGEWYIVDFDKIYADAKYSVLQRLLSDI